MLAAVSPAPFGLGPASGPSTNANPLWTIPAKLPKTSTSKGTTSSNPSALGCAGGTGSCVAAGSVSVATDDYGDSSAFVVNEAAGHWEAPHQLAGLTTLDQGDPAGLQVIACSSPGNCVGGGQYDYPPSPDFDLYQAMFAVEKNGKWGPAQNVPGLNKLNTDDNAQVNSISCPKAGYCTVAGYYTTGIPFETEGTGHIFTIDEIAGKWQALKTIPGTAKLGADAGIGKVLVSCAAPGDCTLAAASTGMFVTTDTNFKWGGGGVVKGMALLSALSCGAAGSCAAVGGNQLATSVHGVWSAAKTLGGDELGLSTVACGGPGDCVAGGEDSASFTSPIYAFVKTEHSGTWDAGGPLPGFEPAAGRSSSVSSTSCASGGNCSIGGSYTSNTGSSTNAGFVTNQINYKLLPPQKFSQGGVGLVSCSASSCGALVAAAPAVAFQSATSFLDFSQKQVGSSTGLALSKAKAVYGSETAEKLTVAVSPAAEGDATGTVVISEGKVTLCRITLKSAKGSCQLSAKGLRPGTYEIIASYLGDKHYRPSVSPARKLVIAS